MAETKNTFIKSKMNQDLDQRLVPNGEYREGFNISVSQAEGADVGTLETVLGNVLVTDLGLSSTCNAEIIGNYVDDQNKTIYLFVTNFVDTSSDNVSNYPPDTVLCQIWRRNVETNINTKLIEGKFLNFSLTHPIMGVNLIEDLLFWTDNRNQPRKINVNAANPGNLTAPIYYSNDDQINVAKYYPYEPINLVKDYIVDYTFISRGTGSPVYNDYIGEIVPTVSGGLPTAGTGFTVEIIAADAGTGALEQIKIVNPGQGYYNGQTITIGPKIGNAQIQLIVEKASTMKDTCTEKLPVNSIFDNPPSPTLTRNTIFNVTYDSGPTLAQVDYTGALVKITNTAGDDITPYLARVAGYNSGTPSLTIDWPNQFPALLNNVNKIEVGINPDYQANWPGDCEFLKDKFVRFAYRFKFDDNEYSLISPFTQPCFIPKQNGYFLSETRDSTVVLDTEKAYEDTDNDVMQNMVTNIDLQVPCPEFLNDSVSQEFSNIQNQLHVTEIEIIYKDDAENSLKVVDTITAENFSNLDFNTLIYTYQSRKPKKTLPSSEITRVSDKVPIRALAQEVTGNRVIYGNYVDGYTAMNALDYEVSASEKDEITPLKKEYPNHTLKQNRSYQVGVVLVDRYGRNSDVILSSLDLASTDISTVIYSGSTVFHPFYTLALAPPLITSNTTWNGDVLRVKFNSKIPLTIPQAGYPGLFLGYITDPISNLYGGGGYTSLTGLATSGGTGTGLTVNITIDAVPLGGGSPLGIVQTVTINNPGIGYKQGDIITITGGTPSAQATFVYNPEAQPNLTGWYSYKIVVKQTEQDYYNVYLPGIVNGSLNTDGLSSVTTANISLFADNINKVPKDLSTVGPSQTNYNSTENLSLRVNNTIDFSSVQNYPGTVLEKVTQISELTDLGIDLNRISITQRVAGTGGNITIPLNGFNDKIQPGMALLSVRQVTTGTEIITSAEGFYVSAYYAVGTDSEVRLNKATGATLATSINDTWTFGPPGVVYNAGNNPLIGILSTSKQIGVSEQGGFKSQLAVAETTPVESLLDIYYETTSSGSISDLNLAISQGIPAAIPVKVTNIDFSLNESQTGSVICTNNFTLLSSQNTVITGKNIEGKIVSVFDKNNNDRTSEFSLSDDNNGTFSLSTTNAVGKGYYVGQDSNNTSFDFNLLMTNDKYEIPVEFSGSIDNVVPAYQGSTATSGSVSVCKNGEIFGTVLDKTIDFECFNGSADTSLQRDEVSWHLISARVTDGENADPPVDDDFSFDWPKGYIDNPNATIEPYQIQENMDVSDSIFFTDGGNIGKPFNSSAVKIRFRGINSMPQNVSTTVERTRLNLLGNPSNDVYTDPVSTIQLVKSITIEAKIEARDGFGAVASPIITVTIIASLPC